MSAKPNSIMTAVIAQEAYQRQKNSILMGKRGRASLEAVRGYGGC